MIIIWNLIQYSSPRGFIVLVASKLVSYPITTEFQVRASWETTTVNAFILKYV